MPPKAKEKRAKKRPRREVPEKYASAPPKIWRFLNDLNKSKSKEIV